MLDLDLNLLGVFDALYELRSVTRTASRLNVTQSAVSHALRRLREAVDDPLFIRSGGALQPTGRAIEMAPGIREGLAQLRSALAPTLFDPAKAARSFTLAAGSYFGALLIPALIGRVRAIAPGIRFTVLPIGPALLADLDDGVIDLALAAFTRVPARMTVEPLFREELVWVAAWDNPVVRWPLAAADLLALPRLHIGSAQPFAPSRALLEQGALEVRLVADATNVAADGLAPDEGVRAHDSATAIPIVAQTDMIALVPRRIAELGERQRQVRILDAPTSGEGIDLTMLWHGKFSADAGLIWLRTQVIAAAA